MRRWSKPTTADSALVTSETSENSETGRQCRATLSMCRSGCTFKIFQEDHVPLHHLQSWKLTTWIHLACNKSFNGFAFSRGKPCQGMSRIGLMCEVTFYELQRSNCLYMLVPVLAGLQRPAKHRIAKSKWSITKRARAIHTSSNRHGHGLLENIEIPLNSISLKLHDPPSTPRS